MKIAVIGSGPVGEKLSDGFLKFGYDVVRGSRSVQKLEEWKNKSGPKATIGTFEQVAKSAPIIVLAVKGTAAEEALDLCGIANLKGKTIIDCTNPISDAPPTNGVLHFFTTLEESLMERLQKKVPEANFVKAFSSVGNGLMVNPQVGGTTPSMFICGNDNNSKVFVREILDQFGWETEDMGQVEAARAIEPLCMLWCIPGFRNSEWVHAFKMLKG